MKVFAVMLGYNRPEVIRGGMENFAKTVTDVELDVVKPLFFECGYPLPEKIQNRARNLEACREFGWDYFAIENKGVMQNHNAVIHDFLIPFFGMKDGDFYVTFDPDVRMGKPFWLSAMVEALESDPNAMFCSSALDFHHHDFMQNPPYNRKVTTLASGLRIARYECLISWASGIWKSDFLITRPRHFGEPGRWYGESENSDFGRLIQHHKTWLSVADYVDYHLGAPDQEYLEWKRAAAAGTSKDAFDVWLKKTGKING